MLRVLIFIGLCGASQVYAEGGNSFGLNRTGFFDDTQTSGARVATVAQEEQPAADNSGKETVNHITSEIKATKTPLAVDLPTARKGTLYLFTTLDCNFSGSAVKKAKEFKRRHPEVKVEGRLICKQEDLAKMDEHDELFSEELPLPVDFCLEGGLSREFGIKEVPAYVFVFGEKVYKIAGQLDLEGVYQQCLPL